MKSGIKLIADERKRQIEVESWTPEHDDEHDSGQLALAAACYATPVLLYRKNEYADSIHFVEPFPWDQGGRGVPNWDKRRAYGERRTNPGNMSPNPDTYTTTERLDLLVKAGALIAAEIDRIQRLGVKEGG